MPPSRVRPAARPRRLPRADGVTTRAQILEAAGRSYAEKGFARTTSKEICARAGANMAAVNYHFGSKAKLYEEVLVEAHRQIVSLDELEAIAARGGDEPAAHLRAVVAVVAGIVARAGEAAAPWGVRVVVRELLSPSAHARTLIERAVVPKAGVLRRLVAATLGLPESHPSVQRCVAFVIVPAMALVIAPKALRRIVLPALDSDGEALIDDLATYMRAGLQAVRRKYAAASVANGNAAARHAADARAGAPVSRAHGKR